MQVLSMSARRPSWPIFPAALRERGSARGHRPRMQDDGDAIAARKPAFDPVQLIGAIAERRDRSAFAALFGFYAPRIKTMLMRAGESAEAAEDIAQETLLTIWRKAVQYDPARASASAWVYAIARNLRVDRLRRNQRAQALALYEAVELDATDGPDGPLDAAEIERHVQAALQQLPEEQAAVVRLSFFDGRAHGDIAESLQLPLGTVKSRIRLAMGRLRSLLGDAL
ncbi:MAG TPA: sigma-70 family RNA polymerase sigma factor [Xanthobacteraceae bacterium]|jgi:RNA polymerase sigma-70 factor (ECF subfamily)|nr:sigma-70 family RNA polymerase sigma factor [Xanthobacteraceae bacterium]